MMLMSGTRRKQMNLPVVVEIKLLVDDDDRELDESKRPQDLLQEKKG